MIKRIVLLICLAMVFGCAAAPPQKVVHTQKVIMREGPTVHSRGPVPVPERRSPLVLERRNPMVIPLSPYLSDPTLGKIKNETRNVFIKVWINPRVETREITTQNLEDFLGKPTFILAPGLSREMHLPFGVIPIYAEGVIKTSHYGLRTIGFTSEDVEVNSRISGGGHYGWYLRFSHGDFRH